ncbi:hypothetical protein ZWY2020_007109 [Hordeum vulgare]|nr:hypothetical protein ZWY2020_007109 [Hordeum vulgare]
MQHLLAGLAAPRPPPEPSPTPPRPIRATASRTLLGAPHSPNPSAKACVATPLPSCTTPLRPRHAPPHQKCITRHLFGMPPTHEGSPPGRANPDRRLQRLGSMR